MTIELYFIINAIFYNEDYLSDLFYFIQLKKKNYIPLFSEDLIILYIFQLLVV